MCLYRKTEMLVKVKCVYIEKHTCLYRKVKVKCVLYRKTFMLVKVKCVFIEKHTCQ